MKIVSPPRSISHMLTQNIFGLEAFPTGFEMMSNTVFLRNVYVSIGTFMYIYIYISPHMDANLGIVNKRHVPCLPF